MSGVRRRVHDVDRGAVEIGLLRRGRGDGGGRRRRGGGRGAPGLRNLGRAGRAERRGRGLWGPVLRGLRHDVRAPGDDRRTRRHRDGGLGEGAEHLGGPAHGGGRGGRRHGGLPAERQGQREADGDGHQGQADEEAFGGDDDLAGAAVAVAAGAASDVPGDALAPHRVGPPAPTGGDPAQVGAGGVEGADDAPRGLQTGLHPLDAHGGVLPADADGGGELAPGEFARDLQPPQRQQLAVLAVEPADRFRDLFPLALQLQPQYGQLGEVGGALGGAVVELVGGAAARPVPYLPHRDRDQPGAEAVRIAQRVEVVDGAQHGLLHDVVDIGVAVEGPADDVVDEGQPALDQFVEGAPVPCLCGRDGGAPLPPVHVRSLRSRWAHPVHSAVFRTFSAIAVTWGSSEAEITLLIRLAPVRGETGVPTETVWRRPG